MVKTTKNCFLCLLPSAAITSFGCEVRTLTRRANLFVSGAYDSTVLVWMTTEVSPFCHASDRVVTVRVTLQELSPNPAANAVNAAISTEMTSFRISFLVIIANLSFVHSFIRSFVKRSFVKRASRTPVRTCSPAGRRTWFVF